MWIFKNNAFVSIVQDKDMPDQLWVRARIDGDLERFFENVVLDEPIIKTPGADYRFRVVADRNTVLQAIANAVEGIEYVNFKNSIGTSKLEEERHNTYLKVWTSMLMFQRWAANTIAPRCKRKKKGSAL